MKLTLFILSALFIVSLHAKSKPVPGFTTFLMGEPAKDKVYTNQIPHGESAVSCIAQASNGLVFAGTRVVRGTTPWIVLFNPVQQTVPNSGLWPLSKWIPGQQGVTALVRGADGRIFGATSNLTDLEYADQTEIKEKTYSDGRLFCFMPDTAGFEITDLGAPFKGEGITALIPDSARGLLYGITAPSLIVFSFSMAGKEVRKLGDLGGIENWRHLYIGKAATALVLDDAGCLFGPAPHGKLFKYDPVAGKLAVLETSLPTEGDGQGYDVVSAFVKTTSGRIFGGTFLDGKLFEFFPKSGKIKALGITSRTGHIRGLAEKNGVLYGFSGSDKMGSRLFVYNIASGEYLSFPENKVYFKNTSIKWVPFQLQSILLLKNGSFMAGENEDNGHLYYYEPAALNWVQ